MTFEELVEEVRPFHNHMCIMYDMEIVRLIGVGRDDSDYYYIVQVRNRESPINWSSAVGHLYSLEGLIPEERYNTMERIFSMNWGKPTETFLESIGEDLI